MIGAAWTSYLGRRASAPAGSYTALSDDYKWHTGVTLSNSNRTFVGSGNAMAASKDAKLTGKWYIELTVTALPGTGMAEIGFSSAQSHYLQFGEIAQYSYGLTVKSDGSVNVNTTQATNNSSATTISAWSVNDVIGIEVDMDTGKARVRLNGGSWTSDITIATTHPVMPVIKGGATSGFSGTINFGQSAWHTNPTSGYSGWTTNGAQTAYRYWRTFIFTANGNCSMAETELSESNGGSNNITGGTASVSGSFSSPTYNADKAIDGNASTMWVGPNGQNRQWWQYDYGSGVTKANLQLKIKSRNDTGEYPTALALWCSSDGSTWWPVIYKSGLTFTSGETKTWTWT